MLYEYTFSLENATHVSLHIQDIVVIRVIWLITLRGGGGRGSKIDQGISNFNLRSNQVRKLGKIPLKTAFFIFFVSLHHPHNRLENISVLYLPLFNSVSRKILKGTSPPSPPLPLTKLHL
jgi:hypothetical protein